MDEYTIDTLSKDLDENVITVPKYQRGAVWNKEQKRKLIDSMNQGFPFGSILLYSKGETRQIIDGLQRSTTIIEYVKNPAAFFAEENLDNLYIDKLYNEMNVTGQKEAIKDEIIELIVNWVKDNHKTMSEVQRMQYADCASIIINNYPSLEGKEASVISIVKEMFKSFQDACDNIGQIKIPALVYTGDESVLPEIFERINSQGAKLTKQQIYSATWAHDIVELKNNSKYIDILNINRDRYENMLDESMELDDYNSAEFVRNKKVNIFELVFGFGKFISKKYPYLFKWDSSDCTKVESIGFNLINACLLQKSANMKNLNTNFKNMIGLESDSVEKFLSELEDAIKYVDNRLGAASKFKGNTRSDSKVSPLHTEMQIVSIIATVFIQRHVSFEIDDNENVTNIRMNLDECSRNWSIMKHAFDENLIRIYTMDIIGQKWKGSGDKKLDNIIIDKYYYNREVTWDEFETAIDAYYASLNSERNERKQVKNPTEPEKLILNIIYSKIFTAADQNNESNYDIEHLATKNIMKEKICSYSDDFRLPISSIANLCLLPEYDNRTKKDKTIYDDDLYLSKVDIKKIQEKYTFTIKSDFAWLYDELSESDFKEAYFKFLNSRFEKMKEKIKDSIF